jgi:hypothetical protein
MCAFFTATECHKSLMGQKKNYYRFSFDTVHVHRSSDFSLFDPFTQKLIRHLFIFPDQIRRYMSHSPAHTPEKIHKPCKVCSSPHSHEHQASHLGICHSCWYKILIIIFIIMIAISYVAWFGIL